MSKTELCPLMSRPVVTTSVGLTGSARDISDVSIHWVECQGPSCAFWQHVYTTENVPVSGCAIALAPAMADGLYRV